MTFADWTAGAVAGTSQAIIGHPFDTVKTRMQTSASHRSAVSCAISMCRKEGVQALWKGITPALAAMVSTSSMRFGIQARANTEIASKLGCADFQQLSLGTRACSEAAGGFAAGCVLPLIFTPVEMIKVRQQVHIGSPPGFWTIARSVMRTEGLRGMYVGHSMTTLRSTIGNAFLFGPYVLAKDAVGRVFGPESGLVRPISGAIAGCVSWSVGFPLDAVKSRMQTLPGSMQAGGMADLRSRGPLEALVELWRERALYRGIGPVLLRSVPVHVAYLPVYDLVATRLSRAW
jgi:solute carrier family 25 carnitine/acylcarnitine transporter 20/29